MGWMGAVPSTPNPEPGDDMTATLTPSETARIAALLDRLDPRPAGCGTAGCLHVHRAPDPREDAPALAA
jgi:hypothetical protein